MPENAMVGPALAQKFSHSHGVDAPGRPVVCKRLRRDRVLAFFSTLPPCLVTMDACGGAQFWRSENGKQSHGVPALNF